MTIQLSEREFENGEKNNYYILTIAEEETMREKKVSEIGGGKVRVCTSERKNLKN